MKSDLELITTRLASKKCDKITTRTLEGWKAQLEAGGKLSADQRNTLLAFLESETPTASGAPLARANGCLFITDNATLWDIKPYLFKLEECARWSPDETKEYPILDSQNPKPILELSHFQQPIDQRPIYVNRLSLAAIVNMIALPSKQSFPARPAYYSGEPDKYDERKNPHGAYFVYRDLWNNWKSAHTPEISWQNAYNELMRTHFPEEYKSGWLVI